MDSSQYNIECYRTIHKLPLSFLQLSLFPNVPIKISSFVLVNRLTVHFHGNINLCLVNVIHIINLVQIQT